MAKSKDHTEAKIESFRTDPDYAAAYLNAVLDDGDQEELLETLRYMAEAFGGMKELSDQTNLNATTLYRTLSSKGNPELKSLTVILKAMGMRLAVQPLQTQNNQNHHATL